jgi:hypothetical protein
MLAMGPIAAPSEFSRRSRVLEDKLGMPRRHHVLKRRDRVVLYDWLATEIFRMRNDTRITPDKNVVIGRKP